MKTFILCLVVCVAAWAPAPAEEALNRFEMYPLGSSDGEAFKQLVDGIVGDDGTVVLDEKNNRLLVVATDEEHRQIAAIADKVNAPPMNVRIAVRFAGASSGTETDIGVTGSGGVIITDEGTDARLALHPRLKHQTTEMQSDVTQQLLVASGRKASLQVGEEVPYVEWFVDYGLHWGILQEKVNWQNVGAFLVVEPTVIGRGPLVQVRLTPELSGLVNGNPYNVRFARAATELTVRNGETISIGGQNSDQDFYSRFLIGFSRNRKMEKLDILLTPEIVDPAGMGVPAGH